MGRWKITHNCQYCGVKSKEHFHKHCKKAYERAIKYEKEHSLVRQESAFLQGRISSNVIWKDKINDRIKELEKSTGISELKRFKKR